LSGTEEISVENGMDVVLILLFAGGGKQAKNEKIVGNTRLDKLMFLLEKETNLKKYIERSISFDAYNFGPYSSELFDSVQALVNAGLIKTEKAESEDYLSEVDRYHLEQQLEDIAESSKSTVIYSLTADGEIVASALFQSLSESEQNEVISIKKSFNSTNLRSLLQYIYRKYPESAVNSLIKDKVC
jgi:uncharacterized protein YwgA